MRLRSGLFTVVLATALPLIAFAAVVSSVLVEHDRQAFVRAVRDRNRAVMSAVDAELAGNIARARQLVTLRSLETNDVPEIRRDMSEILATHRDWLSVVVLTPDGQQIVNAEVPKGTNFTERTTWSRFARS